MKSMKQTAGVLAATVIMAMASGWAQAAKISVYFDANVTDVYDDSGLVQNKLKPGDHIWGIYTFETTTPDSDPHPQVGNYLHWSPGYGIELYAPNGLQFKTDQNAVNFHVILADDYQGKDWYILRSTKNLFSVSAPGTNTSNQISWELKDPSMRALQGTWWLPPTPPDLSAWQQSDLALRISSIGDNKAFAISAKVLGVYKL